ncbi:MAG: FtsQ-type POTRA domain-containing protein [Verrucomicrobia bacterium]|nr:FtsQ-type POTRA domain-containing protein [Verrucomicrobiota bacterium]MBV8642138.1 FtsQ-type POTRA domain-containing protein [Verrucomicrobiota bacterium]
MIVKRAVRKQNKRASSSRQRKHQHLLDVKVRAKKAAARRTQNVLLVLCGLVLIASVLGGIAFGAKRALNALFFANADYALKTIEVSSDGNLSRETILHTADIGEGQNIFSIDLPKVQEKLGSLPQVEESRIQRILPNKLVISVQERRPVAWVAPPDTNSASFNYENAYLLDRRGILLKTKSLAPEYLGLPLIVGVDTTNCQAGQPLAQDEVKAALDLIRASAEILQGRLQFQSIDVSKGYSLVATDKQRASITFSTDEIESQLHRLETVLNYCDKNNRELQTVNLMAQRNVPVTFMPPSAPAPSTDSSAGPGDGPGTDAKPKPVSAAGAASATPSASKGASQSNKLPEKKMQQRDRRKLKPFKEGGAKTRPPGATEQDVTEPAPRVRRAIPVETTRLNG